jgi:ketosteroid isomerase-like protein
MGGGMDENSLGTVRLLEERRWTALTSSDTATLRELFDDGMTYTHSNAMLDSKDSYLRSIDSGVVTYTGVHRTDEAVREFGDTAVVTGRAVIDAEAGGRALQTTARYTAVWARRDGDWRFVSWHATPVAD